MDFENIRCPSCLHPLNSADRREREVHCPHCGASYTDRNGILDFIPHDDYYWGEIDQDRLRAINDQAENLDDWYGPLCRNLEHRPRLIKYITRPSRLGWLFHCYDEHNTEACLDVGSGWGPLSFGLSRFYKNVYSLDRVFERLRFQSIRAQIDGIHNIRFLRSDFLKLPISDQSLDLVVLNGVLEWVGMSDPGQKPDELQRRFLEEIARVLKPEGRIYLGIENRLAYHYFLGHKDHSGLPFTSLVPRSVADWMVSSSGADGHTSDGKFFHKAQRKYRTYTYTLWGYTKLLRRAGFDRIASYWAWQSYSYPRMSGSLDAASIRYMALNLAQSLNRSWQKWLVRLALALPDSALSLLVKLFSPDFLIVAGRDHAGEGSLQDRILDGAPAGAPFVRVSHASSPTLETTYLRLDRKANAARTIRVTPRTPLPPAPQSLVLAGEEGTAGRLLRLSDKGDITLAARWLSDFQHRSEKGQWTDEQLAAEIRTLTAAASDLPEFEALRQPLMEFEAEYVHALKSARLPIVTEQGSFIPLNIIITPEGDVCPADWRFSSEQGMPLMDIGGLYLSLLRRASRSVRSGKRQPVDGPAAWFAQEFQRPMGLPFSMAPVYYLLRVIQRVKEGREAVPSRQSAYAELSGLLNFVLVPNSSTEDL